MLGTIGNLVADSAEATGLKWAAPAASGFKGCELRKSANQSISNLTDTAVTFDSETFDTDGFHSTSSNTSRITIPAGLGGKYRFTFVARFAGNSTGLRNLKFNINGSEGGALYRNSNNGSSAAIFNASIVLDLSAGDYVEMIVFQDSGGSLNLEISSNTQLGAATRFGCEYLGA